MYRFYIYLNGEDHEEGALDVANIAKDSGLQIYVIGVGTPKGAPIPMPDGRNLLDQSNREVISSLNEEICANVSENGGGRYFRLDETNHAQELLLNELSKLTAYCVDSDTITMDIVTNLVANSDFSTTSGWSCNVYSENLNNTTSMDGFVSTNFKGKVEAGGAKVIYDNFITSAVTNSDYSFPTESPQYLTYTSPKTTQNYYAIDTLPVLVSSGPYSQRSRIKNLTPQTEYIAFIKYNGDHDPAHMHIEVAYHPYSTTHGVYYYDSTRSKIFLDFKSGNDNGTGNGWKAVETGAYYNGQVLENYDNKIKFKNASMLNKYKDYYYQIFTVPDFQLTEEDFQKLKVQIFCMYDWHGGQAGDQASINIEDLEIVTYTKDLDGNIITLKSDIEEYTPKRKYVYYDTDDLFTATKKQDLKIVETIYDKPDNTKYTPVFYNNAEKIRQISLKESNYFNGLSTLSETFQSWLRFNFKRDPNGRVEEKRVVFKSYAGEQTWAGFRYGANLKSIKRTLDSKNIVTKMIVKNNNNQGAKNGFCSIARAPMNELGENFILNFDYYIQKKLITEDELNSVLYNTKGRSLTDQIDCRADFLTLDDMTIGELEIKLQEINESTQWHCYAYANRLNTLNTYQRAYSELQEKKFIPLNQVISDLTVAEAGEVAAQDAIIESANAFYALTHYDISDVGFSITIDSNENDELDIEDVIKLLDNNVEAKSLASINFLFAISEPIPTPQAPTLRYSAIK